MDALVYLLALGFSGTDAIRALLLLLFGALFISRQFLPWKMTLLLLVIDTVWPYAAMLKAGYGLDGVNVMIRGTLAQGDDALAGFLVRAAGFYVFLRGTFSLRRKLHNAFPDSGEKAKLFPF